MRNAEYVFGRTAAAQPHVTRPLVAHVFEGLSEDRKQLPSVLLYDARGSQLFEQICEQPEYYLSRAETRLLGEQAAAIAGCCGPRAAVIEYGAGSGRKTQLLLDSLEEPASYVPLDVDAEQLDAACRAMRRRFPTLPLHPLVQDFRQFVSLPPVVTRAARRVAFFSGSTIGNFRPLEAVALLNSIRESMGSQGALLIGVDLLKDRTVIERAYNDAAGVTAAFNLNVLARLNREVDATFDLAGFRHRAVWNEEHERIEMSVVSQRAQAPSVAGISIALAAGEEILTEYCHKYSPEGFAALAHIAGWTVHHAWIDAESQYSLQFLEATGVTSRRATRSPGLKCRARRPAACRGQSAPRRQEVPPRYSSRVVACGHAAARPPRFRRVVIIVGRLGRIVLDRGGKFRLEFSLARGQLLSHRGKIQLRPLDSGEHLALLLLDVVVHVLLQHLDHRRELDLVDLSLLDAFDQHLCGVVLDLGLRHHVFGVDRLAHLGVEDLFLDRCMDRQRLADFRGEFELAILVCRFEFLEHLPDVVVILLQQLDGIHAAFLLLFPARHLDTPGCVIQHVCKSPVVQKQDGAACPDTSRRRAAVRWESYLSLDLSSVSLEPPEVPEAVGIPPELPAVRSPVLPLPDIPSDEAPPEDPYWLEPDEDDDDFLAARHAQVVLHVAHPERLDHVFDLVLGHAAVDAALELHASALDVDLDVAGIDAAVFHEAFADHLAQTSSERW